MPCRLGKLLEGANRSWVACQVTVGKAGKEDDPHTMQSVLLQVFLVPLSPCLCFPSPPSPSPLFLSPSLYYLDYLDHLQ